MLMKTNSYCLDQIGDCQFPNQLLLKHETLTIRQGIIRDSQVIHNGSTMPMLAGVERAVSIARFRKMAHQ